MAEAKITAYEFDYMLANPGAQMRNEAGDCTVHYASGSNLFVMIGRGAPHTLFAGSTDLDRLNAHWVVFSGSGK